MATNVTCDNITVESKVVGGEGTLEAKLRRQMKKDNDQGNPFKEQIDELLKEQSSLEKQEAKEEKELDKYKELENDPNPNIAGFAKTIANSIQQKIDEDKALGTKLSGDVSALQKNPGLAAAKQAKQDLHDVELAEQAGNALLNGVEATGDAVVNSAKKGGYVDKDLMTAMANDSAKLENDLKNTSDPNFEKDIEADVNKLNGDVAKFKQSNAAHQEDANIDKDEDRILKDEGYTTKKLQQYHKELEEAKKNGDTDKENILEGLINKETQRLAADQAQFNQLQKDQADLAQNPGDLDIVKADVGNEMRKFQENTVGTKIQETIDDDILSGKGVNQALANKAVADLKKLDADRAANKSPKDIQADIAALNKDLHALKQNDQVQKQLGGQIDKLNKDIADTNKKIETYTQEIKDDMKSGHLAKAALMKKLLDKEKEKLAADQTQLKDLQNDQADLTKNPGDLDKVKADLKTETLKYEKNSIGTELEETIMDDIVSGKGFNKREAMKAIKDELKLNHDLKAKSPDDKTIQGDMQALREDLKGLQQKS